MMMIMVCVYYCFALKENTTTVSEYEQEVADLQSCLRTLQEKIEVVNQVCLFRL